MSFRRVLKDWTMLDAVTATTTAAALNVSDFKDVILSVGCSSSPNLQLKVQGAIGTDAPTFSSNSSRTNMWDFIEITDLEDGAAIDGDTGVVFNSGDASALVRLFQVNTDLIDWISVQATAFVTGTITVKAGAGTNL